MSWWCQIILSVIAGVILTFANTVRGEGSVISLWTSGFSFSCLGVITSFINCLWTWNTTRLYRRYAAKKIKVENMLPTVRKYSRISITISVIGMFFTLLGAEQIVG